MAVISPSRVFNGRKDSLKGNASSALLGRLASASAQVACLLIIDHRLGSHALDRYVLIYTLTGLAGTVIDFGSGVWLVREIAAGRPVRFAWRTKIGALFFIILAAVWGLHADELSGQEVAWGLVWTIVSAATMMARGILWGLRAHHIEACAAALETCGLAIALAILPMSFLEPIGPMGLALFAYGGGLAYRSAVVSRRNLRRSPGGISVATLAPYGLHGFVSYAGMRVDVVLLYALGATATPGALAGYALALRAYAAAAIPLEAVSTALLPRLVTGVGPYIGKILRVWLGGGLLATAGVLASLWLLPMIEGSPAVIASTRPVLMILVFSVGLRCGASLLGAIVTAQGRQSERLAASAASLVTMVGLDFLLIPTHGVVGAAWAFAISDAVLVSLYGASAARIVRTSRTLEISPSHPRAEQG